MDIVLQAKRQFFHISAPIFIILRLKVASSGMTPTLTSTGQ
jgi:hypothetical protein